MEIKLRKPKLEDFESYHEIFSDSETHHFIIDEGIQDTEGSRRKLNTLIKINGELKRIYSIVGNDVPLGFIVIHYDGTKMPFISYAVRRSFRRKGIASLAIDEFLKTEDHNFEGFKAATHLENLASQQLLKKSSFSELGEMDLDMGKRIVFEFKYE